MFNKKFRIILVGLLQLSLTVFAQQKSNDKYPSLLWEITGNGLTRPSYLFGTMHVSSKLVFHLSDSFYNAIKKVEAVALELNPDVWQGEMIQLNRLKENYASFVQQAGNDFVTENSFRIKSYVDELKSALQTEPAIVNNLLYRSYKTKEDFEEDTFLDLYIFQTGRKLGKKAAGVENYYEAERLVLEAYADMAKEKKKKNNDLDVDFMNDYVEKIQQAYRKGDLDLMDSLDNLIEQSIAFREKFLYKRNEIQANSIDSIIRHTSLFAGVGAAHLPGSRGVIELLRKKGYKLKPVKMADRNGLQKNSIDVLHVPVVFQKKFSDDKFYSVNVPGDLYKVSQDYNNLDRRQYADMSNGAYYLVTRVKTHAAFLNEPEKEVLRKVDSVLYENIPGKILTKKAVENNGYTGYDITNRTRRGDLQRYQIFVTPFEIIIFKMSGKENYVAGKEAGQFFSSISLKSKEFRQVLFQPAQGGFSMQLPQMPIEFYNNLSGEDRWEYEAADQTNGDAYLIFKKSIYNFNFIEEDTFDLSLAEASFCDPDHFERQLSRVHTTFKGFPALEINEKLKNGSFITACFFVHGPHYYVVAHRTSGKGHLFDSFTFQPFKYGAARAYTDTFLRAVVQTAIVPEIDEGMRSLIEQTIDDASNGNNPQGYISYWPKPKNGIFKSDSTGEMIAVQVREFPKYYFIKDSAKYWQEEISSLFKKRDMYLYGKVEYKTERDFSSVSFSLRDTGSSRMIRHMLLLKNNFMYGISTVGDTINGTGELANKFFKTFRPLQNDKEINIYQNRVPVFFNDLLGDDSALLMKARQSIGNINYGIAGIPLMLNAINTLSPGEKDYYSTKSKLISEMGYIKDTTSDVLVTHLKNIYQQTSDTSLFQNEVIKALSRIKTKAAYQQLKALMISDPPIFENNYDYTTVFNNLEDSLALTVKLFPEMMQLASLDDYKEKVIDLLVKLVDSGFVKQESYDRYFSSIYIDAIVALKKQKAKDEKQLQAENKTSLNDDGIKEFDYNNEQDALHNYSVLLMPYYDKNLNVRSFFTKLLYSKDNEVKLNTAILMIRNNKPVPDSLIYNLAANDRYRSTLYREMEKINKTALFPSKYKSQLDITRSSLVNLNDYSRLDSIVYLSKQQVSIKKKTGWVYFYKYRIKKAEQWKIGLSGIQPDSINQVSSDISVLSLTGVKLSDQQPVADQLNLQLKKMLFSFRKSGKNFFEESDYYNDINTKEDYDED
ncbi:MAG: TraB/GumN family protein [Ferruginibacter sp.]